MFSRKKFTDVKSLINLSLVRLNTLRKKANQELGVKKRVLAKHLQEGEFALARLEAERIVKLDWKVETLNLIEIKCEEVRDNVPLLDKQKEISPDLQEAVATVIYCDERAGIPELKEVVRLLERKYGQEYIIMQRNNGAQRVDERLVHRLSGQRPNAFLVYNYMKEIAASFGIEWYEDEATKALGERFDVPMSAGGAGGTSASGIGAAAYQVTDGRILPKGEKPKGYTVPEKPDFVLPSEVADDTKADDGDDEGGSGGQAVAKPPIAPAPKKFVAKPPPAKPKMKPVAKKTTPPKPIPKSAAEADGGLADLQARFAKLQDL